MSVTKLFAVTVFMGSSIAVLQAQILPPNAAGVAGVSIELNQGVRNMK